MATTITAAGSWLVSPTGVLLSRGTATQRAFAALQVEELEAGEVKRREHNRKTTRANLPESSKGRAREFTELKRIEGGLAKQRVLAAQKNNQGRAAQANLPEQTPGQARDIAAEKIDVAPRYVQATPRWAARDTARGE